MTSENKLVLAVRAHAYLNYEKGGWDYVCECYSDEDIEEIIGKARTAKGAIKKVRADIKPRADYREEVRAEIF